MMTEACTASQQEEQKGSKEQLRGDMGGAPPVRSSRSKQRGFSRFLSSLCCCVAPQREYEKCGVNSSASGKRSSVQNAQQSSQQNGTAQQALPPPSSNGSQYFPTTNGNSHQQSHHAPPPPNNVITQVAPSSADAAPSPLSSNPITQITPNSHVNNGAASMNGAEVRNAEITAHSTYLNGEKLLLPALRPSDLSRKCLIIDLDETLVHSSFKPVKNPDFVIPVEIDGVVHQVYVLKRPYVDEFLARVGEKFECVLFTASLAKYADPVADLLDKRGVFRSRLFREACVFHKGNYIKDLGRLGRDLNRTIIVDNSPTSYAFHPHNAIPVQTWFEDPSDCELLDILPLLDRLAQVDSVYSVLRPSNSSPDTTVLLDRPYS